MTEYQMDSDELQRLNTSCEFKTIESGIQEACKHIPPGIFSLKQIQFYSCFFVADGTSILLCSLGFSFTHPPKLSVSVSLPSVLSFSLMHFRCAHHQNIFSNKIMTVNAFKLKENCANQSWKSNSRKALIYVVNHLMFSRRDFF